MFVYAALPYSISVASASDGKVSKVVSDNSSQGTLPLLSNRLLVRVGKGVVGQVEVKYVMYCSMVVLTLSLLEFQPYLTLSIKQFRVQVLSHRSQMPY